jgi:hypothetical protein
VITKEKKDSFWEHEIVWFFIEDIIKATNLLETMQKGLFSAETLWNGLKI